MFNLTLWKVSLESPQLMRKVETSGDGHVSEQGSRFSDATIQRLQKQLAHMQSTTKNTDILADVAYALEEIRRGTYNGICNVCGEEIPFTRLVVVPYAQHCMPCQVRLELSELGHQGRSAAHWSRVAGDEAPDHVDHRSVAAD
ncbi:TraR/DksA family transcriptional regulator [Candidatus Peregrinibacteria bacterium]|nr:TraR/DksA family transcriptional regulator [Candidatus Peregrinibacteria bacterium]